MAFIFPTALPYAWPCSSACASSFPSFQILLFFSLLCCILPPWPHDTPLPIFPVPPPLYQASPMTGHGHRCWGEPGSGERTRVPLFEALS